MQNKEIEKAIPWNPWHGCKKVSVGCKNCFVYKMDQRYGKDASIITKGKTTYELKDKDCPPHSLVVQSNQNLIQLQFLYFWLYFIKK